MPAVQQLCSQLPKQAVGGPEALATPVKQFMSATSRMSVPTEQPDTAPPPVTKKSPEDFIFKEIIGEGSFSTVYLAKELKTGRQVAIKVCEKRHILRERKKDYVLREKEVMNLLNTKRKDSVPFFVKLYSTFHDAEKLYFEMSYAARGDVLQYIRRVETLDEECSKFYAGELLQAIEHMHSLGIVHRDLKPENILLSETMHILISDFGSCKLMDHVVPPSPSSSSSSLSDSGSSNPPGRRASFVGTAQYVSPEVLSDDLRRGRIVGPPADLWAFGCILYQFVSGLPPFRGPNDYIIFKKVLALEYQFPEGFLPNAQDLVQQLLKLEPTERLGASQAGDTYTSIKNHPFFNGVDFDTLYCQTPPKILPHMPGTTSEDMRSSMLQEDEGDDEHLQTGLDTKREMLLRVGSAGFSNGKKQPSPTPSATKSLKKGIMDFTMEERQERLVQQAANNSWHRFVDGNLILKQGFLEKRKGLFPRRRMFLLTTGPHLFYVDPNNMVLKGQVPWSSKLRTEIKTFKIFFIHTPNRTYYLEDTEGFALKWKDVLDEVYRYYFGDGA